MNNKRLLRMLLPIIMLLISALACSLPGGANTAATQTMEALATIVEANLPSGEATKVPDAVITAEATQPPAQATEEALPTPTVAHLIEPSSPGSVSSFMTDRSSAALASERRANADIFDVNLLERPFTTQVMDYQEYLDIIRAELSMGSPWVYVTIFLEGPPPAGSEAAYGVEVDLDIDGKGDWLILADVPPDSAWTTDGVRACRDANGDVGGPTPMISDSPHAARDGYEDCVFDSGYGIGPDEAWIRRDPGHADRIQIAFLYSLIGNDGEFMWGAWSDESLKDPAWFDYHDHFTLTEAGSPASESSQYPVKAMASLDNTCRWGYGFVPTGSEPGVCYIPPTPTPLPQGSISGYVYAGYSSSVSSERLQNVTVTLGQGSCSSSGYKSTTTNSDGYYSFSQLPPGTYCVSVIKSTLPPASYGWGTIYPSGFPTPPGANPYHQMDLAPNGTINNVNFGFQRIIG
ncbi:MAG: carboxypeptidase regulatory-like domain-containing protein [Anaerolineales bacterium]|nr:carboxypeptidase regulatory-like domain-containing protein [Anaerolineales bacterium]